MGQIKHESLLQSTDFLSCSVWPRFIHSPKYATDRGIPHPRLATPSAARSGQERNRKPLRLGQLAE